jgi:hypothetical protein
MQNSDLRKLLKYLIKQANRQIKSTIAQLGIADGKGLLILLNDGNHLLETDAVLYLIGKLLGQRCRSIHSVIYLTVNLHVRSDREPGPLPGTVSVPSIIGLSMISLPPGACT